MTKAGGVRGQQDIFIGKIKNKFSMNLLSSTPLNSREETVAGCLSSLTLHKVKAILDHPQMIIIAVRQGIPFGVA